MTMSSENRGVMTEPLVAALPQELQQQNADKQMGFLLDALYEYREKYERERIQLEKEREYIEILSDCYEPLHRNLFQFSEWTLHPDLVRVLHLFRSGPAQGEDRDEATSRLFNSFLKKENEGVFSFPVLDEECCRQIFEEVSHFDRWAAEEGIAVKRPNSMNRYGAILDHFGFKAAMNDLMTTVVEPFARFLFSDTISTSESHDTTLQLDEHHAFVVEYEVGKDTSLDFHVDDSEVTLNLCLGDTFQGGDLFFGGVRCESHQSTTAVLPNEAFDFQHVLGRGLIHLGKHRHAAKRMLSLSLLEGGYYYISSVCLSCILHRHHPCLILHACVYAFVITRACDFHPPLLFFVDITAGRRMNLILWCRSQKYRQSLKERRRRCLLSGTKVTNTCPEWCGVYGLAEGSGCRAAGSCADHAHNHSHGHGHGHDHHHDLHD
eukprot:TRINITY_DN1773_c0_g1_i1.p1 TRINITY_DN1773_c0_g1~~TRINITY_DN1773_c0_g1_i1.p1  ORF type:complete len:435 (-),score=67.51 TRINITY_DN1773_c0_g1_i1:42-1346(-)